MPQNPVMRIACYLIEYLHNAVVLRNPETSEIQVVSGFDLLAKIILLDPVLILQKPKVKLFGKENSYAMQRLVFRGHFHFHVMIIKIGIYQRAGSDCLIVVGTLFQHFVASACKQGNMDIIFIDLIDCSFLEKELLFKCNSLRFEHTLALYSILNWIS